MKISKLIHLLLILPVFLVSCEKEMQQPLPDGIPDKDIVFIPEKHPSYANADINTLGFINADGTGREEYSFVFAGGAKSMFGKTIYTRYADSPNWSSSGDALAFGIRNTAPNIRLINSQGYMYGKNCDQTGDSTTFDRNGYITKVLGGFDSVFDQYQHLIDENHIVIAHFDLENCAVISVSTLDIPSDNVFGLSDETLSGQFTISYYGAETEIRQFLLYEPTKEDYQVFSGFFPELNKNGTLLAYYSSEGMLIIKNLETGVSKRILEITSDILSLAYDMSAPSWSPDGEWLVYSTVDGDIYKVNVETSEKIYLTHGWSPDWR